jgi:phage terminase large subunit-like protein
LRFKQDFKVVEVPYDPRFASYFATKLAEDGLPMVEIAQTAVHFTQPIIEIENMVLENTLHHDGNAMVEWMMSNVVMRISKFSGLKQPTKETNREKIDGPVAMLLAVGRALKQEDKSIRQGFVAL